MKEGIIIVLQEQRKPFTAINRSIDNSIFRQQATDLFGFSEWKITICHKNYYRNCSWKNNLLYKSKSPFTEVTFQNIATQQFFIL